MELSVYADTGNREYHRLFTALCRYWLKWEDVQDAHFIDLSLTPSQTGLLDEKHIKAEERLGVFRWPRDVYMCKFSQRKCLSVLD